MPDKNKFSFFIAAFSPVFHRWFLFIRRVAPTASVAVCDSAWEMNNVHPIMRHVVALCFMLKKPDNEVVFLNCK